MTTKAINAQNEGFHSSTFGSIAQPSDFSVLTLAEEWTDGSDFKFGIEGQFSTVTTDESALVSGFLINVENKGNPFGTPFNSTTVGMVLNTKSSGAGNYSSFSYANIAFLGGSDVLQTGTIADFNFCVFISPDWQGSKPSQNTALNIQNQGSSGITYTAAIKIANQTDSDEAYGIDSAALTRLSNDLILTSANKIIIGGADNGRIGTGTLVAGTVTIANTSVTENTRIILTTNVSAAGAIVGVIGEYPSSRIPGSSFVINSSLITDTNSFTYLLIEEVTETSLFEESDLDSANDFIETIQTAISKLKPAS